MAKKKAFNELTEQGKKQRLAKYAKEREARGTTDHLVRLVKAPKINEIKGGNKQAVFRLAEYNKEKNETEFFTATAFIAKGKDKLEAYYAGLEQGDLVSVEIKAVKGYNNVYDMITRQKASQKDAAPAKAEMEPALEA